MKNAFYGAAIAALTTVGAANAGTVNVTYQPDGVFGTSDLYEKVSIATAGSEVDGNVRAGMFHLVGDGGMGDFLAFCVDLKDYLRSGTEYTMNPTLFGATILSNVNKLFYSALGGAGLGDVIDTSVKAAGLQVALWEVIYETAGGYDLNSGYFSMSDNDDVLAQATSYLDGMSTASDSAYNLTFLSHDEDQDIVTISAVPLPASGLLIGFALVGLGVAGRRRKAA
jgi:hypothetical protein